MWKDHTYFIPIEEDGTYFLDYDRRAEGEGRRFELMERTLEELGRIMSVYADPNMTLEQCEEARAAHARVDEAYNLIMNYDRSVMELLAIVGTKLPPAGDPGDESEDLLVFDGNRIVRERERLKEESHPIKTYTRGDGVPENVVDLHGSTVKKGAEMVPMSYPGSDEDGAWGPAPGPAKSSSGGARRRRARRAKTKARGSRAGKRRTRRK